MEERGNILTDPQKLTNLLVLVFVIFFGIVAIVAFTEESRNSFFNDAQTPNNGNDTFEEPEELEACPNNLECCTGRNYQEKQCPIFEACIDNFCTGRACPFECCEDEEHDTLSCPVDLVCVNNNCIKQSCPFECCDNDSKYLDKICFENKQCVNNNCELNTCDNECCDGKTGFEDKLCSGVQECSSGSCIKPECTARCCLPADQDYQQKDCPSHSKCVGRVCAPRF